MGLSWILRTAAGVIIAGDAIKYAKEAILKRCDMAFDQIDVGTRTIQRILVAQTGSSRVIFRS